MERCAVRDVLYFVVSCCECYLFKPLRNALRWVVGPAGKPGGLVMQCSILGVVISLCCSMVCCLVDEISVAAGVC